MRRRNRRTQLAVRREHPVESSQMHPWRRHQRGKPRQQIQRFQHDVRSAVSVRSLERVAHLACWGQRQTFHRNRRAAHVAAQPFELLALVRLNVQIGMQREATRIGGTTPIALLLRLRLSGRNSLQREQLLPCSRAH